MESWIEAVSARQGLGVDEVLRLIDGMPRRSFARGEIVVRQGETDSSFYLLVRGIWRGYRFKDGEEATAWFGVPGEVLFSVWGYVSDRPSRLAIESVTDSEAVCLPKGELNRRFSSSIAMANLGRKVLENFVLLYENWHIDLWKQTALDRYMALLDDYPEVVKQVPMKCIASYIGVTVQSLSRIRALLAGAKDGGR